MKIKVGFLISFIVFLIFVVLAITVDESFFIFAFFGAFFGAFLSLFIFFGIKMFKNTVEEYSKISRDNISTEKRKKEDVEITPVAFHAILIITTILSLFIDNTSVNNYYDWFWEDFRFQLVSSLLFILLAIFNPYVNVVDKIKNKENLPKNLQVIKNKRSFFIIRLVVCLVLIIIFIKKQWLVLPSFQKRNLLLGLNIFLIFYIFRNIYLMITQPFLFFKRNVKVFFKSLIVIKGIAFVLIPMVPLTMLSLHLLGGNENDVSLSPFAFIGFNALMLYFEFKIMPNV